MTHIATLARLAVLELWASFRLLLGLTAMLASGAVALLAGEVLPRDGVTRPAVGAAFAIALGLAIAVVAALVAGALATERRRGFSGWLVSRTAPRATLVVAWFLASAPLVVGGGIASSVVAWLAMVAHAAASPDAATAFSAAVAACLAAGLAGLALGLLAGGILPPLAASLVAGLVTAAWLSAMAVAVPAAGLPGSGFTVLATFHLAESSIAAGLASAGASLATAAVILVLALVAFERVDL